jgi:hypothetical protein
MAYQFAGTPDTLLLDEDRPHYPASEEEARAKFAYFRDAESKINGGPAPIYALPDPLKPLRPRLDVPEHGTNSGYARHMRLKETPCRPCLDARGHYQREYRAGKKAA